MCNATKFNLSSFLVEENNFTMSLFSVFQVFFSPGRAHSALLYDGSRKRWPLPQRYGMDFSRLPSVFTSQGI